MKKKNKGRTIISLIITIIILLILAGITINLLITRGLLKKAENATNRWEVAQREERNIIDEMEKIINQSGDNEEKLEDDKKYEIITTDDGMWEIYKDIDTKTTKVNVYVTSKYYYPSLFKNFFIRMCYANI